MLLALSSQSSEIGGVFISYSLAFHFTMQTALWSDKNTDRLSVLWWPSTGVLLSLIDPHLAKKESHKYMCF